MPSGRKGASRDLASLGNAHSYVRRRRTVAPTVSLVTVDAPRKRQKRTADNGLDDSICPGPSMDVTVARLLGATDSINVTSHDSPVTKPTIETEKPTDRSNVILPYDELLNFQTESFCCRNCFQPLTKSKFEKIQVTFATSINYDCTCKKVSSLQAQTKTVLGDDGRYKYKQTRAVPHLVSDYSINNQVILAMQQVGCGQAGAAVVGGMLSITPNAFHNTFTDIEVEIGKKQVSAGTTILDENVEKEKLLSEVNKDSQHLFCVAIDNAWNNRGSGRSYNSDSSHHITVGNRTGLVVALHYMSKRCTKCENEESKKKIDENSDGDDNDDEDDPTECPRNY